VLLRAAYDKALANCDVLAMPTIPFPATEIPSPDAPREVYVDAALNMQQNTCPFDVSGHPAFTVLAERSTACRSASCWSDATSRRRP
jgi:amidase